MNRVLSVLCFAIFSVISSAHADDNLQAFPPAEKGMVRHVLHLPKQEDEFAFKVELIAGKTIFVDEANRYFFSGKIEEQIIEGWGFPKYILSKLGPMAGTLIAVDPNEPKVERFIALGGEPVLIRYNSKLPVVVYAPEGVEIRYRVWTAGLEKAIKKG